MSDEGIDLTRLAKEASAVAAGEEATATPAGGETDGKPKGETTPSETPKGGGEEAELNLDPVNLQIAKRAGLDLETLRSIPGELADQTLSALKRSFDETSANYGRMGATQQRLRQLEARLAGEKEPQTKFGQEPEPEPQPQPADRTQDDKGQQPPRQPTEEELEPVITALDEYFDSLGESYQPMFGKGSWKKLDASSPELQRREQVVRRAHDMILLAQQGGQQLPFDEAMSRAVSWEFPELTEKARRDALLGNVKRRAGQIIARPSNRQGAAQDLSPEERATMAAREGLEGLGIDTGMLG